MIFYLYNTNSYIIKAFSSYFNKLNITYELTNTINESDNSNIYIIFESNLSIKQYPQKYILFCIDNKIQHEIIQNSFQSWNTSILPLIKYTKQIFNKSYFLPYPIINNLNQNKTTIDILCYDLSDFSNKDIYDYLITKYKNQYNILYVTENDTDLSNNIKNSRLILFLHSKNISISSKLNYILSFGKPIICECIYNIIENEYLLNNKSVITFIPQLTNLNNTDNYSMNHLCQYIDYYLNYNEFYINQQSNIKLYIKQQESIFEDLLQRLLCNINQYSFLDYKLSLNENKIYTLTLPEIPIRYKQFTKQSYLPNTQLLNKYYGIKNEKGWIGCGQSYQHLIYNAKINNLDYITICEDDCLFKPKFELHYNKILQYLNKNQPDWCIFAGLITQGVTAFKPIVKNIHKLSNDFYLVEIESFVSMVFNIYNKNSYDTIINWDKSRSIDGYCFPKFKGKIYTCYPYLVNCIDESYSTISTSTVTNNYQFSNHIKQSERNLKIAIDKFIK